MKYFSKEKFIESMRRNRVVTEEELQYALETWANDADGKTVEELKKEGLLIHDRWVIEADE